MASLSVLSYNLSQGLKMKSNENSSGSSSLANSNNNNSLAKTFNKITVQNVLSENTGNVMNITNNNGISNNSSINNANAIVKKIKDFGMIGAVNAVNSGSNSSHTNTITVTKVGVTRKRPPSESKISNSTLMKPAITAATPKKPKLSTKAATTPKTSAKKSCENVNQQKLITQVAATGSSSNVTPSTATTPTLTAGTPGRKGLPAPQAVARRNARERNRVKQVNNGFAALRERIPEEVAEAFEAQGNGRAAAASKKLSKVETLRMAVEYIRSLERLLGFDFPLGAAPTADDSFALIKDEFGALSPGLDDQYNDDSLSNYELDEDFAASHPSNANNSVDGTLYDEQTLINSNVLDLLPNITTLNGLQYIRIPGTSTYQLLTADIFAGNSQSPTTSTNIEDEQFNALIDTNCQSPRSASSSVTTTADDLHGSPTATAATTALIMQTTAAPALHQAATNGDHVRRITSSSSSSLSRSPVPQTSSSPNAATSMIQQQLQDLPTTTTTITTAATLSPVGNDELLLQTCADDVVLTMANNERLSVAGRQQFVAPVLAQHQQQQRQQEQQSLLPSHKIKQEFNETNFNASAELSTNLSAAFIYQTIMQHNQQQQQQQQQLLLEQTSMSMSPPLDRVNSSSAEIILTTSSALPGYFEQDHNASFYDGIVTFKKERNVLDNTSSNTTAVLSDESMMEAIDWWEAHTPKSDGGSVIM